MWKVYVRLRLEGDGSVFGGAVSREVKGGLPKLAWVDDQSELVEPLEKSLEVGHVFWICW